MKSTESLVAAYAVLHTVEHILTVSTDLADAKQQVSRLQELVRQKAVEEQIPDQMLRDQSRTMLQELL